MKPVISYPIKEIKEEKGDLLIKAYIDSSENKILNREGVFFKIPNTKKKDLKITFAVMNIEKKNDDYILLLHSHDCECCEKDSELKVSKEIIKKWTGLNITDIDSGLRKVSVGYTYNLLVTLPRLVIVNNKQVEIEFGNGKTISPTNPCSLILDHKYPLDNK